jgi:polyphenol oxidase
VAGLLHSSLLEEAGFRHAFFTRTGGHSRGAYAALNFSYAVGDEATHVDENLAVAARALGVASTRLFFPAQVHEAQVIELVGTEATREVLFQNADALVSGQVDLACAIRTADCLPILIGDLSTGRVAAIHAGWRGLVRHVIKAAAAALGGDPRRWVASIGPHISRHAFEVSPDVAAELEACSAAPSPVDRGRDRPHVDLSQIAAAQLEALGVPRAQIDALGGCTYSDPTLFFSFRRDGKASGRHLAAIVPRKL